LAHSGDDVQFLPDGIGHLLSDRRFAVPLHQRSYKWEREDHVRRLFEDVADAMNDPDLDVYFLGMIVLMKQAKGKRLEVIDGQQRLATVSIFYAAVRDYFRAQPDKENQDRADEIQAKYLSERDLRTREPEPHLHLNLEDKEFYLKNIIEGSGDPIAFAKGHKPPASHRRIADAVEEAKAQVKLIVAHGSAERAGDRLLDWVEFFHTRARVVAFIVDADQNAYTLFETLNDRGLELTKADLIKNYLFSRAQDRLDEVRDEWARMTATLEAAGDESMTVDFIRHHWLSKYSLVRTKHLYKEVKKKFHAKNSAREYTADLAACSKLYAALLNPDAEFWNPYQDTTRDHVRALKQMNIEVVRPIALAVMRRFDVPQLRLAFRLFVHWSVRFLIVGGFRGEALESAYSQRAVEIDRKTIRTAGQLAKAMSATVPSDDTFKSAFAIAHVSKPHLARYYLRAIEDSAEKQPNPERIVDPKNDSLDLEHIYPLNPDARWKPKDARLNDFVNHIGNQALLPKLVNKDLGNAPFATKKEAYMQSGLKFTQLIAKQAEWEVRQIEERAHLLAEEAIKTWPMKI
jgi:hypothetical protein